MTYKTHPEMLTFFHSELICGGLHHIRTYDIPSDNPYTNYLINDYLRRKLIVMKMEEIVDQVGLQQELFRT